MPARIRVYELARELGLTNKETLDLCLALGIGVKSHSSSIEDAQADRVRRKAEREGLKRDVQPAEPAASSPAPTGAPAPPAPGRGAVPAEPVPGTPERSAAGARPEPDLRPSPGDGGRPADAPHRLVTSRPASELADHPFAPERSAPPTPERGAAAARAPAPAPAPAAPARPMPPPPRPPGAPAFPPPGPPPVGRERTPGASPPPPPADRAPQRPGEPGGERPHTGGPERPAQRGGPGPERPAQSGGPRPERPRVSEPASASVSAPAPAPGAPPAGPAGPGAPEAGGPSGPAEHPRSASGKLIPPPPGFPKSTTGKPIPPPPGFNRGGGRGGGSTGGPAGRSGPPGGARTGAPARPGGPGRPGGGGAGRPGGPGRPGGFGGDRPGGGPGRPTAGAGAGRPGGGPPGRGGPGQGRRPPQRRRRRRRRMEELEPTQATTYTRSEEPVPEGEVVVERASTAQQLGPKLNRTAADVVRFLYQQGEMVTATQSLTDDMIELFAAEVGAEILLVDPGQEQEVKLQELLSDDDEEIDESELRLRPPVITVMGHVDHGKTLLLDRIRNTNVVAGEAGGITQHIGAYQVEKDGRLITFIDTPGHEAFTAMRARGAEATDIAVLVVAADDGVMPQTVEAINHAKAAEVPIVVAINKVDRENADPTRVRQGLSEHGLVPEEWGGDTIMVEVSALQNQGIDDLLEQLLVVAEVEDLRALPEGRARGVVLEANLDVGRGPVATVLVEQGTLQVSDPVVAGAAWGRVRAMLDERGDAVKEALPSTPVLLIGLSDVPSAGDEFRVAPDDKTARIVAEARGQRYRIADLAKSGATMGQGARLEDLFEQIQRGETATLNLILKADVHGSLEALTQSLQRLERDDVKLAFVHRGVGGITENDVTLAAASNATIIGFNVRPDRKARELGDQEDVEIRTYQIIYQILEDIEKAMVGLLAPEVEEVVTGEAEVREIFRVPRVGGIAGCYVRHGVITRGSKVRFLRDGVVIWTGAISSLKRFKEDAREVAAGFECGIGLSDFQDLNRGDIIETYEEREIPRT